LRLGRAVRRILLVDGDADAHAGLASVCAAIAEVRHVRTGAAGLQALLEETPHLVVMEQRLSDVSGLDLLAAIKVRRPWIPVIVATAWGSERVCAEALKLGARDYFIKPWSPADMQASVRAILATTAGRHAPRSNVLPRSRPAPRPVDRIDRAIREAARRISEQAADAGSFAQLAAALGLSKSTLSRRFKRTLNISYRRFVRQSRIERARTLLDRPGLTITEIAQAVGFGDLPRFDKVFKAVVGTAPSLYRRAQRRPAL
jgi:AraC-like DNA-binding protein/CheY-like chemotaxis protein